MPSRSQTRIRRDLNRLNDLIEEHATNYPALSAVQPDVAAAATRVNRCFQAYQQASVTADRERTERDVSIAKLREWVQQWRPVALLKIPGAASNLRALPASGATPDDQIRLAEDLRSLIQNDPAAEAFRDAALGALGELIELARKETPKRPKRCLPRKAPATP